MQSLFEGHGMTKMTLGAHPFLLGFDQLERLVERTAKSGNDGFPPYNIEQASENRYRITLALAGFREEDLSIRVEDRQLVIRGRQAEDTAERAYLHRGIATRQFQRSFVLADGVEVSGATMEHGLLHVDLMRSVPETVVQTIKINGKTQGGTA
jgi:HSP20 family molecular chaperone IbpA